MKESSSKHIDGITDLVVVAPIKDGFIKAFEAISHASRLELVANALNRIRVAAREFERVAPYSDATERILGLLDFRVGVIDNDLFGLVRRDAGKLSLEPKRFLYLTATFDGGFEPYMRQIWRPLGSFLDLLFCHCEGYVTATEHGFEEYIQWVRDNQVDSAIFYSTTGVTVRDQKFLTRLERAQRDGSSEEQLARLTMAYPEDDAAQTRAGYPQKAMELGFEALNVLHRLTDYFPPEWMTGGIGDPAMANEGHRLIRVTRDILLGWDPILKRIEQGAQVDPKLKLILKTYEEPVNWYKTGSEYLTKLDTPVPPDPAIDRGQVQDGILFSHGPAGTRVRTGALMLFTVRNADAARAFIKTLVDDAVVSFDGDDGASGTRGLFANIAFTAHGLLELGMFRETLDAFPKEFREGAAQRSGLVGDMRENHPRNWILPARNGPEFLDAALAGAARPPVELDEVDFVLQLRSTAANPEEVREAALKLARAAAPGASLEAIEWLHAEPDAETGRFRDHFGFVDGISQPRLHLAEQASNAPARDRVALGEVLLGYGNDRGDGAPTLFGTLDGKNKPDETDTYWRNQYRGWALDFQQDGSFLVIRKIGEDTDRFEAWLDAHESRIAAQLGYSPDMARALLKAAIMGRDAKGCPLGPIANGGDNDFDFKGDKDGSICPHAAHIRRANPRRTESDPTAPVEVRSEFGRPSPRLVRRGMLFGNPGAASRGLVFMAYAASISEQYEVIQRWLNGANPTDVASSNNDPLTGVRPKDGTGTFRFVTRDAAGNDAVVRVPLPEPVQPPGKTGEPGRHPFTPLYWGLYLFTPSRRALVTMTTTWKGGYQPLGEMLEEAVGAASIGRLRHLDPAIRGREWKRILEDYMTKDPTERDVSSHVWAAIRYYSGGVLNLDGGVPAIPAEIEEKLDADGRKPNPPCSDKWSKPDWATQNVIVCAGERQVMRVLADWDDFTSEEQLRRIIPNAGPIYVTQQPDNRYICLDGKYRYPGPNGAEMEHRLDYHAESAATNAALLGYGRSDAFLAGYNAGLTILGQAKKAATALGRTSFKMEMRRQYFQPAIAEIWKLWYGLPDDDSLFEGGWSWKRIVRQISEADPETRARTEALCPGDFMAPSRGSVFPRPNDSIKAFAQMHGTAILGAGRKFVAQHRQNQGLAKTPLIQQLFAATHDDEVLARNIIGTMIGAIPPMEANLRNILFEWLNGKRLWRHQAALQSALAGHPIDSAPDTALAALHGPVSQAMCIRPAPDMLFRTAKRRARIKRYTRDDASHVLPDLVTEEGDIVIVSLASASQRSLSQDKHGIGNVDVIFGGKRAAGSQGYTYKAGDVRPDPTADDKFPVHACPAQEMAMGGMTGILAALLDAGTIQALPASLILKISDW